MKIRLNGQTELVEAAALLLQDRAHSAVAEGEETVIALNLDGSKGWSADYQAADKCGSVQASEKAFLFRGLMQMIRHLEEDADSDWCGSETPWAQKNGIMVDCSRNSVLTTDMIRAYIRLQASMGMNSLMLYTEDTYEVPEYPTFGAYRGRYSSEELAGLADYAEKFGVEMIPCIQALAHLKNALRWEEMQGLQDTDDILMVGEEKVYDFVKACIKAASAPFHTKRIHLGMDEAWALGLGKYLSRNGYQDKKEIMTKHLDRVMGMCREMGLEPMIWSDMYLRMESENNEYYDVPLDSDLSNAVKPAEGVTLVYWDYYHEDVNFYKEYLRMHRQLSDRPIFAGGGWVWNGLCPNLKGAESTTHAALKACRESGVEEIVCTMWQDDGAETPMIAGLPTLVRYAETGFASADVTDEELEKRIADSCTFYSGIECDTMLLPGCFDRPAGADFYDNPTKQMLYQDPMLGLFDYQNDLWDVTGWYQGLAKQMHQALAVEDTKAGAVGFERDLYLSTLRMYEALAIALSVKADLGAALVKAYAAGDKEALASIASEKIPACAAHIDAYKSLREQIWERESRPFGFEVIDVRIGGLQARLTTAKRRIERYLAGELTELPELAEKRIPFRPVTDDRKTAACNSWRTIVSASPVAQF